MLSSTLKNLDHLLLSHFILIDGISSMEFSSLNNQIIDLKLACSSFHNHLLDRALSHEPIDSNFSFLANSMRSINSLEVNLWVPITVIHDDYIGLMQINAEAASACREQEYFLLSLWVLEHLDSFLSEQTWSFAINSNILVFAISKKVI